VQLNRVRSGVPFLVCCRGGIFRSGCSTDVRRVDCGSQSVLGQLVFKETIHIPVAGIDGVLAERFAKPDYAWRRRWNEVTAAVSDQPLRDRRLWPAALNLLLKLGAVGTLEASARFSSRVVAETK